MYKKRVWLHVCRAAVANVWWFMVKHTKIILNFTKCCIHRFCNLNNCNALHRYSFIILNPLKVDEVRHRGDDTTH